MKTPLIQIFLTFFKIGIQLIGGGYVIIPLLKDSIIDKKNWIKEKELIDYYSISQCLPGLTAVNISMLIGHKKRGTIGAIAALLGLILPSFIIILVLASVLLSVEKTKMIENIFWGIRISVIVLIFLTVKDLTSSCIKNKIAILIYMLTLPTILLTNISPALIIIIAGIIGVTLGTKIKEPQ